MLRKVTLADVWMETSTGKVNTAETGSKVPTQNPGARPEDKDLTSVVSLSLSLSDQVGHSRDSINLLWTCVRGDLYKKVHSSTVRNTKH